MDYEVEILVLTLRQGYLIVNHPVSVKYFEGKERISHFRPFKDNWLMARLHCKMTLLLPLYWQVFYKVRKGYLFQLNND